jgi:peptidoglycan/xylan/chitin deacetylase (PgdA/CDA1 family)
VASIDPVVCASAAGPGLARSLDAVAAETASTVWLALAGLDASAEEAAVAAAQATTGDVRVLHARGPGFAAARNAALAASGADVLAFVEEDVVVAPGWLAALSAAWDTSPDRVAAVGGPISIDLDKAWHTIFATLDYGDEPLVLDPGVRTLHGGNLSVRTAPLRAGGGFFPARGHRDGRDWFSEEHHAQRELAKAGWEIRYEPSARVVRVPDPEALRAGRLLRRRWRYGARMRVVGRPRQTSLALRQAVTSAAGAALAVARRQPALALERGGRAAENTGLLIGAPIARRDFRATGPRPFGHQIPEVAAVRRGISRRRRVLHGAAILLYHRVDDPTPTSGGMCVAPDRFADQMERLTREHAVVKLDELVESVRAGRVPRGAVAVTIDDGYLDTLANARPRLAAAGVPATLFVATGHVAEQRPFFWDELERLLLGGGPRPGQLTLSLPGGERAWRTDARDLRVDVRKQIHDLVQPASPDVIDRVLAALSEWADVEAPPNAPRAMTVDELRELASDPLITIGAHTRRHANLGFQGEEDQRDEIEGSRDDLSEWLGLEPTGFAYPFGIPDVDFTATTRRLVAEAGFRYSVANQPGNANERSDLYALPRHFAPDLGGEEFSGWLQGALGG